MRVWVKIWKDGHMLRDTVLEDRTEDTRTHKVFRLLQQAVMELDLEKPIWLDSNVSEFQKTAKTKFYQDSFIERIPFDCLEFQVIEE
ncbi:MAG: hypothetical protein IJJ38_00925 [Lachnospiraceae bacterium]|nr:hypothetical protein [Lachnospiraceae bacterium]